MTAATQNLIYVGTLEGHSGWVTSISTPSDMNADFVVSGSRGIIKFSVAQLRLFLFINR